MPAAAAAGTADPNAGVFASLTGSATELWKHSTGAPLALPGGSSGDGSGNNYDLPFLDLHYYNTAQGLQDTEHGDATQAQALDLAQSKTLSLSQQLPPTLVQHIPMFANWQNALSEAAAAGSRVAAAAAAGHAQHQRGQSVVSPQDLLLTKGDNKRKRSSWDGGAR